VAAGEDFHTSSVGVTFVPPDSLVQLGDDDHEPPGGERDPDSRRAPACPLVPATRKQRRILDASVQVGSRGSGKGFRRLRGRAVCGSGTRRGPTKVRRIAAGRPRHKNAKARATAVAISCARLDSPTRNSILEPHPMQHEHHNQHQRDNQHQAKPADSPADRHGVPCPCGEPVCPARPLSWASQCGRGGRLSVQRRHHRIDRR